MPRTMPKIFLTDKRHIHLVMGLDLRQVDEEIAVEALGRDSHREAAGQPPLDSGGEFDERHGHPCKGGGDAMPVHGPQGGAEGRRIADPDPGPVIEKPGGDTGDEFGVGTGQGRRRCADEIGLEQDGMAGKGAGRGRGPPPSLRPLPRLQHGHTPGIGRERPGWPRSSVGVSAMPGMIAVTDNGKSRSH